MMKKKDFDYESILSSLLLILLVASCFLFVKEYPRGFKDLMRENDFKMYQENRVEMPLNQNLPKGYISDKYVLETVSDISCQEDFECKTPAEYLVQSRCPFYSKCLNSKCSVVCPAYFMNSD